MFASRTVTRVPRPTRLDVVRIGRVDYPERFVVGDVVRAEVVLDEADDVRGDVGQPLGAVGLIVVVRRDRPQPALVGHLERGGGGCLLVELHHLEGGRRFRGR